MSSPVIEPVVEDAAELLIAAVLREQRARRPECQWLAAHDFAGTGRCVIVPVLPAIDPAVYDTWPWRALAGYHCARRELPTVGFSQADAR